MFLMTAPNAMHTWVWILLGQRFSWWHPMLCTPEMLLHHGSTVLTASYSSWLSVICVPEVQLYGDFSRFPPAEAPNAPQLSSESEHTTVEGGDDCPEYEVEVVKDRTQVRCCCSHSWYRVVSPGLSMWGWCLHSCHQFCPRLLSRDFRPHFSTHHMVCHCWYNLLHKDVSEHPPPHRSYYSFHRST
jgi:hypothetical protein